MSTELTPLCICGIFLIALTLNTTEGWGSPNIPFNWFVPSKVYPQLDIVAEDMDISPHKKIAFLFLSNNFLPCVAIWSDYFKNINISKFNIYMHVPEEYDDSNLPPLFRNAIIPFVSTAWGTTGMAFASVQLLMYGFHDDPNNFKFVFISDTTIPVKSFNYVYGT